MIRPPHYTLAKKEKASPIARPAELLEKESAIEVRIRRMQ
jgi:hypothetical protein